MEAEGGQRMGVFFLAFWFLLSLARAQDQCYNLNYDYGRKNKMLEIWTTQSIYGDPYAYPGNVLQRTPGWEEADTIALGLVWANGTSPSYGGGVCTSKCTPVSPNCKCFDPAYGTVGFIGFIGALCGSGSSTSTSTYCHGPVPSGKTEVCKACDSIASAGQMDFRLSACGSSELLNLTTNNFCNVIPSGNLDVPANTFTFAATRLFTSYAGGGSGSFPTYSGFGNRPCCQSTDGSAAGIVDRYGGATIPHYACGHSSGGLNTYKWNGKHPSLTLPSLEPKTPGFAHYIYNPIQNAGGQKYAFASASLPQCVQVEVPVMDLGEGFPTVEDTSERWREYKRAGIGLKQYKLAHANGYGNHVYIPRQEFGNFFVLCRTTCSSICSTLMSCGSCTMHPDCVWCGASCFHKSLRSDCGTPGDCNKCQSQCNGKSSCQACIATDGCGWCGATNQCVAGDKAYPCNSTGDACPWDYKNGTGVCNDTPYWLKQKNSLSYTGAYALSVLPTIFTDSFDDPDAKLSDRWTLANTLSTARSTDANINWANYRISNASGELRQYNYFGNAPVGSFLTRFGTMTYLSKFNSLGAEPSPALLTNFVLQMDLSGSGGVIGVAWRYQAGSTASEQSYYILEWGSRNHFAGIAYVPYCNVGGPCPATSASTCYCPYTQWRGLFIKHRSSNGDVRVISSLMIAYDTAQMQRLELQVVEETLFGNSSGTVITVLSNGRFLLTVTDRDANRPLAGTIAPLSICESNSVYDNIAIYPYFRELSTGFIGPVDGGPYWTYFRYRTATIASSSVLVFYVAPVVGTASNVVDDLTLYVSRAALPTDPGSSSGYDFKTSRSETASYYSMCLTVTNPQSNSHYYFAVAKAANAITTGYYLGLAEVPILSANSLVNTWVPFTLPYGIYYVTITSTYTAPAKIHVGPVGNNLPSNLEFKFAISDTTTIPNLNYDPTASTVSGVYTPTGAESCDLASPTQCVSLSFEYQHQYTLVVIILSKSGASIPPYTDIATFQMQYMVKFSFPVPTITTLTPQTTAPTLGNVQLQLTGTNYGTTQGLSTVTLNGVGLNVLSWADQLIKVTVPSGQGVDLPVVVTVVVPSAPANFSYHAPDLPVTGYLSLTTGTTQGGYAIVITGTDFGSNVSLQNISFGGNNCPVTGTSGHTQITCTMPEGSGTVSMTVTVAGQSVTKPNAFTYASPTIANINPPTGAPGNLILIRGTNFGPATSLSAVSLPCSPGSTWISIATPGSPQLTSCTNTAGMMNHSYITCQLPVVTGTVTGLVAWICVNGQQTNGGVFSYSSPTINSIDQSSGGTAGGYNVTITGSGFGNAGLSTLTISDTVSTYSSDIYVLNATAIAWLMPAYSQRDQFSFTVARDGLTSASSLTFTYNAPTMTLTNPLFATSGGTAIITGQNLGGSSGTITVSVNGAAATPTARTDTGFNVNVPAGSGNNGGSGFTISFQRSSFYPAISVKYTYSPPSILNLASSIVASQGTLTINGQNFGTTPLQPTITMSNTGNGIIYSCTSPSYSIPHQQITCIVGPGQGKDLLVKVALNGLTSSENILFSYPAPSITSWSTTPASRPTSALVAGTAVQLTVNGNNFGFGGTSENVVVSVGGTQCSTTTWSSTQVICPLPSGEGLNFPVTLTIASQSSTASSLFTYDAPSLTSLSPSSGTTLGLSVQLVGTSLGGGPPKTNYSVYVGQACRAYDNVDTVVTTSGTWQTRTTTTATGSFTGLNYLQDATSGANPAWYVQYTPNLPNSGNYSISAVLLGSSATFDIMTSTGNQQVTVSGSATQWTTVRIGDFILDFITAYIRVRPVTGVQAVADAINFCSNAAPSLVSGSYLPHNHTAMSFAMPAGTGNPISVMMNIGSSGGIQNSNALTFSYTAPTITSIGGCTSSGGMATNCAIDGSQAITIIGTSFGSVQTSTLVYLKDRSFVCNIQTINDTRIVCQLPAFPTGGQPSVFVMAGGQVTSQKYLKFRGPVFTSGRLSKCDGNYGNVLNFTNNLPGQSICFEGTDLGTMATTTVTYGTGAVLFPCTLVSATSTQVQCTSTEGIGRDLTLSIVVGQLDPVRSTDVLSYPIPIIQPNTIRNLPSQAFNGDEYVPDAIRSNYQVTFDVKYLPYSQTLWPQVSVSFGRKLPPDATWRTCGNPQIYSLSNPSFQYTPPGSDASIVALSCTAPSGFSTGYHFRVLGLNTYSDYSSDTFSYLDYGLVLHNVSGCGTAGISTENCPTTGGTTLTLRGVNFCDFVSTACALTIEIGGNLCTEITYWNSSVVTCNLPAGTGGDVGITIIQDATFANMEPPPTISYAIPTILKVSGCMTNSDTSTSGCPQTGSATLTISGKNFGASNAIAFIGTKRCTPVVHDSSQTYITCALPRGFGSNNLVTVYDSTGRKSLNSSVSVSYQPCKAGTMLNRDTYACDSCDEGSYTDTAGSYSCHQCAPGRYASTTGLTVCSICSTGKHALNYGSSNCDNCTTGQYQQSLGQSTCTSCSPGFFANITGLSTCYSCPSGRSTSNSGALSCTLCLAGNYAFQAKQCLPCPAGSYSGSDGVTACTSCSAGTYSTGGVNQCTQCASGSVAVKTGMVQCEPCALGYYANSSNPISCNPCQAGYVTSSAGQASCSGCNPGFYVSLPGQATCLACPQGRFQNYSGQTLCQNCYPGTFNPNTTGSAKCSLCASGYYTDVSETAECLGCQSGYFSNASGSVSCTVCPSGTYQDNSFQSKCIDCPTGKANQLTGQPQCEPCASGAISNKTGLSTCIQCVAGYSQSSASACTICAAGLYQPSDGQQSCLQCSAGRYSSLAGSTTCYSCGAGNFSLSRGSTQCSPCPTGQYSANVGSSDCLPCLAGYNSSSLSSTGCTACPPGYYQGTSGSTSCLECKAGYYNQFYGSATCPFCVAGYFTNQTAQTVCIGCDPGRVNSAPASQSCDTCGVGRYTSIVGQQSCLDCQGGRFTNRTGTSSCTACDSGTYSATRATTCTPCSQGTASGSKGVPDRCPTCSPGTFSTAVGATSCKSCPMGEYSLTTPVLCLQCPSGRSAGSNGTAICPECAVGYYQPYPGQSLCLACTAGTITAKVGEIQCTTCDAGKYVATDGQSLCLGCPPGKWNNVTNATGCEPCDAGYYSGLGKQKCTGCPPGTTSDAKRQKCDECPPGFWNNETASLNCNPCPPGTYQSQPGQNSCTPCQSGRSSVAQAIICEICPQGLVAVSPGTVTPCSQCEIGQPNTEHTACECGVGKYANWDDSGKTNCYDCDVGASCDTTGITWETLKTAPGYWRTDPNSTLFYRCLLEDMCAGGRNSSCDTYRTGPLCALCLDEATEDSTGKCIACQTEQGASIAQVFFIILAIIIALIAMYALLLWSDRALVQMVIAYDTVEIDKQRQLEDLRRQYGHKSVVTESPSTDPAMSTDEKGNDPEPMKTKTEHSDIEYRPIGKPNITYKLKIILSFFQIATNLTFALNIPWPRLFARFVSAFNFINLDFIQWSTVGCVASIDYYIELVLITLLPIATIIAVVTFYLVPFFLMVRGQDLESQAARSRHLKKVWKLVLFSMFLVYPKVSSTVLNLFVCREIAGVYYLVADLSLECYTGRWTKYLPYDVFMILAYPIGIPAFFLFLLIQNKPRFHLPGVRLQLGFLYDGFDSNTWWFELADMLHKLLLTSVLAFFPIGAQMPIGMSIAIVHLTVIILGRPYYRKGDDRLHMFAQVELFLLMLAGFVCYKGNGLDDRSDVIMSLFLIFVLTGFLSVFLIQAGNIVKKQWQKYDEKRKQKDLPDMYLDVSASGLAPPSQSEIEDSSRRGSGSIPTRRRGPSESISIAGQVSGVKFLKAWTRARRQENKAQIRRKGAKTLADIQEATDDAHMERNPMWRDRASSQDPHQESPSHMSSSITTVSDSSGLQEVTLAPDVIAALQAVSPIPFHYESAELSPSEESRPLMNEPSTPDHFEIKTDFPPTLESAILEAPPQNVRKSATSTPKLKPMTPIEVKISATPTRASVTQRFFPSQARKSSKSSPVLQPLIAEPTIQLPPHMELAADTGSDGDGSLDNSLASGGSQEGSPALAQFVLSEPRKSTEPRKSAKS